MKTRDVRALRTSKMAAPAAQGRPRFDLRCVGFPARLLGLGLCVLLSACGRASPPNILLISIDTLRQDHVSVYGYPRPTTPTIDRLAAEGVLFENAYSTTSWTLPAHVSVFTGLLPGSHQVEDERDRLGDSFLTLPEYLHRRGYATAGFASHVFLRGGYGFDRGFDTYEERTDQTADQVTDQAIAWLAANHARPFFLFAHYFDPHWDYRPPAEFARRFDPGYQGDGYGVLDVLLGWSDPSVEMPAAIRERIVGLYDGEIAFADHHLGRLVSALRRAGLLDRTIVVLFSDHGEEFKDHGSIGHGGSLYAETTRVPMVVRFPPRVPGGSRIATPASISDLPATLASLTGLDVPRQFVEQARDLTPMIRGATPEADRTLVLSSTRVGPPRFKVVERHHSYQDRGSYRYIHAVQSIEGVRSQMDLEVQLPEALYDLTEDARELHNRLVGDGVTPASRLEAQRLRRELWRSVESTLPGVRVTCDGGRSAPFAADVLLSRSLLDEPVVLGLEAGDRVTAASDSGATSYRVELSGGGSASLVLFPLAPGSTGSLRLGSTIVPAPAAGGTTDLSGLGQACRWSTSPRLPSVGRGRYSQSAEEVQRLRALGYLR